MRQATAEMRKLAAFLSGEIHNVTHQWQRSVAGNSAQQSRRLWLKASSVGVIGGALGTESGLAKEKGKLRIALIAEPTAGHVRGYLGVLSKRTSVESIAVADATGKLENDARTQLKGRFNGFFRDASQMLAKFKPQLTIVTMQGHRAPSAIQAAIDAGSHVLTEKPSCTKLADFESLAAAAKKRNLHLMLAMATRSSAPIKKACKLIKDGLIGKPYSVNLVWVADQTRLTRPAYHESWLAKRKLAGGGKLIFHGIHYLDVSQFLLGLPIKEINGFAQNVGGQPIEVEDSAVVALQFAQGVTGTLNTGYYIDKGKQSEIRIWGSQGWIRLEHQERNPLQWYSTHPSASRGVQTFEYRGEPGWYDLFFQEAIDAIRRETPPPITTAESLSALRVVFAGYEAIKTKRTQTVKN